VYSVVLYSRICKTHWETVRSLAVARDVPAADRPRHMLAVNCIEPPGGSRTPRPTLSLAEIPPPIQWVLQQSASSIGLGGQSRGFRRADRRDCLVILPCKNPPWRSFAGFIFLFGLSCAFIQEVRMVAALERFLVQPGLSH
jgi:hypothetical protein